MPNTHSTLTSLFSDIADAIRGKTGSSATIVADDFPTAIASIPTGGGSATIEPLSVTANGTYTAPSGVDGYSPVVVNVSGGSGGETIAISFKGFQGKLYYVDTQSDTIQKVECTFQAYTYTVPLNSMVVLMWSVPRNPDFSPTNLSLAYSVGMGSRANYNYVDVYLAC